VAATPDGFNTIDGFISNTANYVPTKEPFMTATQQIGGNPVDSANFFQFNPFIDEEDYDAALYTAFVNAGFPASIGMLIDTSRNGWGSSARPAGPSTSTDLNTFVNASRIDLRNARGQWCNQSNSGLGVPPTVSPGFFPQLQAFVWIKPPGESDGTYSTSTAFTGGNADENCDPAHSNALANNTLTGSLPNPPSAGKFFPAEFTMLVQNAFPAVPGSTTAGFSVAASGASVLQGASVTDSVTVSSFNGFNGVVTLSASGLPAGVTATFSPATVIGSAGSTLTLSASNTAAVGAVSITVTGTSGSMKSTATVTLNVIAKPDFTIAVSPATLSVAAGTTGTATVSVGFVGGLTGSVSVSASNLPAGVSANFAPSSVNGTGTVSVSFFVQPGTAAESGNVTITGTNGTLSHSATVALTVAGSGATSGFKLTPSAATLAMAQGSSATDTITVTDMGTFNGSVMLAASGMPSGVTASFGTNPTTGSSVVTVSAASTAAAGTFTLTISGTSGSNTASTSIAVTVGTGGNNGGGGGFACHVDYTISTQWSSGFTAAITINNTGTTAISAWTLTWTFANGQTVTQLWNGMETQSGANVTVNNLSYNGSIPAGGSYSGMGFNGSWNGTTNAVPASFAVNGTTCQ
jgi:cellulose 1,4-beta-cellobiosidase